MGLFSTVLHIYKRNQVDIVSELSNELGQNHNFSKFLKIDITNADYENVIESKVYPQPGLFYLITEPHSDWTTIIELNVNIDKSIYLYELTNSLSSRLNTYSLSFHLHDDDVLYYNLENQGKSLDGYNSNYQYFLIDAADKNEVLSQRHTPNFFSSLLPATKNIDSLNLILNEGYWDAFDNNDLNEHGIRNGEKYDVDEEDRFVRVGKYLEIFSKDDYPFANWRPNLQKLNLANCYLLKVEK
jgi:hypothetical protein